MENFSFHKNSDVESVSSSQEQYEKLEKMHVAITESLAVVETHEPFLRSLFKRELRRAGVEDAEQKMETSYVPLSEVHIAADVDRGWLGQYDLVTKDIRLNSPQLYVAANSMAARLLRDDGDFLELKSAEMKSKVAGNIFGFLAWKKYNTLLSRIIGTLEHTEEMARLLQVTNAAIHEELHALTHESRYSAVKQGEAGFLAARKVGVQENSSQAWVGDSENFRDERYRALNEGITQLYTMRLGREFLKQAMPGNLSGDEINIFFDLNEYHSYTRERWVTEQMVVIMTVVAGVPENVVQDALFAAYLNNEAIIPEEIFDALMDAVHEERREDIEALLLRLQLCLGSNSFRSDSDIHAVTAQFVEHLSEEKRNDVKERFAELFFKYNYSKDLQDGVVG